VLEFRGYIDESHDSSPVPKVFSLTCIVTFDNMRPWFEMAWMNVIEKRNAELKSQGRPQISRYHAADCSNLRGEFEGWTIDEQIDFSLKLFAVFRNHPIHIHSYDMPLQLMVQQIPATAANPVGFAYVILLTMLIAQIGENTLALYPNDQISLYHDHCDYDGALADAFKQITNDPIFTAKNSERFVSIGSETWQNCIMLQPVDMIAYENFKEGMRHYYPSPKVKGRRKSLSTLLDLEAISGRASGFDLKAIQELKSTIDSLGEETRVRLFKAARIISKA
jgi:hypothetical protein